MNIALTELQNNTVKCNTMKWNIMQKNSKGIYCAILSAICEVWYRIKDKMTHKHSTEIKINSKLYNVWIKLYKKIYTSQDHEIQEIQSKIITRYAKNGQNDNYMYNQADATYVCAIDALKTFSKTALLKRAFWLISVLYFIFYFSPYQIIYLKVMSFSFIIHV